MDRNREEKGGNAWCFHLILLNLQQVLRKCSNLWGCISLMKRLKEQNNNN